MSAVISKCGRYRYELRRDVPPSPGSLPFASGIRYLVMVMLNPSTADASTDDPTIRRCIGLAARHAIPQLVVVNLFALRSSSPAVLTSHQEPSGPENDFYTRYWLRKEHALVVAAWGAHPATRSRVEWIRCVAREEAIPLYCLGITKAGHPRHPLYVPNAQPLVRWQLA
jgi:hypothetical protein